MQTLNYSTNLTQLIKEIRNYESSVVLGLDVFDTILIRYVDKPSDSFNLVDYEFARKFDQPSGLYTKVRLRAEREARLSKANSGIMEITLDDIYEKFSKIIGTSVFSDEAKKIEVDTELAIIDIRKDVLDTVNDIRSEIDSIYLISDTYLPRKIIESLLKKAGVYEALGEFTLVISCEEQLTKHDGKLLPHTLEKYNIDPKQFIYVGDNVKSDIINGNKAGIRTIHAPNHSAVGQKMGVNFRSPTNSCVVASRIGALVNREIAYSRAKPFRAQGIARLGTALAPLWAGFMGWLIADVRKKKIEKIFFLTRDGYVFAELSKILAPSQPRAYMTISREILYRIYFYVNFEKASMLAQQNYSNLTLGEAVLRLFESNEVKESALRRLTAQGYALTEDIREQPGVVDFIIGCYKKELISQGQEALERYFKYLKNIGFLACQKVAIMDLGWHGSLQKILKEILNFHGENIEVNGYYLGLFAGSYKPEYGSYYNGYLCDNESEAAGLSEEATVRLSPSLIEILHCAPHGSASSITMDGKIVLRKNDATETTLNLVQSAQGLAFSILADCAKFLGEGYSVKMKPSEAIHNLKSILTEPTADVLEIAAEFQLAPDYGTDKTISLLGLKGSSESHWIKGTTYYNALKNRGPKVPAWFNETSYLQANPDVAEAVSNKIVTSGFDHFMRFGKKENRKLKA